MIHIITTTQVQQKIGQISDSIGEKSYIVTNRGEGRMILLPYYDGCDDFIDNYMEDYKIMKNKDKLAKKYQESRDSGLSNLVI